MTGLFLIYLHPFSPHCVNNLKSSLLTFWLSETGASWKCREGMQEIPSSCELQFPYPTRNLPARYQGETYCGNGSAHTNNSKIIGIQKLVSIQIDARSSCCQWGKFQGPSCHDWWTLPRHKTATVTSEKDAVIGCLQPQGTWQNRF